MTFAPSAFASCGSLLPPNKRKIAATVSCHAAIKINMPLEETKMRWLVDELMKTDVPTVCPHGRPIILRYDLREIEKAFKRA